MNNDTDNLTFAINSLRAAEGTLEATRYAYATLMRLGEYSRAVDVFRDLAYWEASVKDWEASVKRWTERVWGYRAA
jgi:hypothetical protein